MMMSILEAGWQLKHTLVWRKNNIVLGRADYKYQHEPILYGWKDGAHSFFGLAGASSVWDIPKPQSSKLHPTMKPLKLMQTELYNSSTEGDQILDLFGGSGSTLIACEQLNRVCYIMELDPKYCQIIIDRWQALTKQEAVKLVKSG
jgi:DNA modification methylase